MYKDGEMADADLHADLPELVNGSKPGRESAEERCYFNAVGLAYTDISIAYAMYERARDAGVGQTMTLQEEMIFEHETLKDWIRL